MNKIEFLSLFLYYYRSYTMSQSYNPIIGVELFDKSIDIDDLPELIDEDGNVVGNDEDINDDEPRFETIDFHEMQLMQQLSSMLLGRRVNTADTVDEPYQDRVVRQEIGYSMTSILSVLRELHEELGNQIENIDSVRSSVRAAPITSHDVENLRETSLELLRIGGLITKRLAPEMRIISADMTGLAK